MSQSNAKNQGTAITTSISSRIASDTARRLIESRFFVRRTLSRHFLLACMCAATLAVALSGCKSTPDKKPSSPAAVEFAAVEPKPIRLSDEFNGRVASINSVDVRARVTGYVDNVAYREGDSVKRGDLLFVIDPRPYRDALDSAKARLEREKAAAAFANILAPDLARSLGKRFPSSDSFSPASGMWAAIYIYQANNRWIRARFRNYGSPIAVRDKDARSVLQCEDTLYSGHIILEGRLRLLHDADVEAIFDENVVNALPARTICPGAVNQNNIPNAMLLVLR
jgi:hypothetical protein